MTASQAALKICQPSRPEPQDSAFLTKGKEVSRKHLINALNHINFKEKNVILVFQSVHGNPSMEIEAFPMPVLSDYPTFRFLKPLPDNLRSTDLTRLIIPDGPGEIHAIPQLRAMNSKGLSVNLPETGRRIQGALRNIRVHFQQQGIAFKGSLTSIEPDVIEVQLSPLSSHYFMATSPKAELNLTFLKEKNRLFKTKARVVKQESHGESISLHLKPMQSVSTASNNKQFESRAFEMIPAPDFQFSHPLTTTKQTVVIDALSAVHLSCTLHEEMLSLIPGMTLENAKIVLGELYELRFNGEVIHCKTTQNKKDEKVTKCIIRFISMSPETHLKLQSMIHKAKNQHIGISAAIDSDDLWRFFFETNFIYKNKYKLFLSNKKKIKQTYQALYSAPTDVTRHVTYHEKGRTMGHASMLRYAENAWLFHHHAALKGASMKVGLGVLNHMNHYLYDSLWLKSAGIKYLLLYFRPENSFPNFVFNGFTEKMGNPKISSVDLFAYSYFRKKNHGTDQLANGWTINKTTTKDIEVLEKSYQKASGGLLTDALDLAERQAPADVLSARYRKAGLKKERQLWTLHKDKLTVAILIVNISDVALNMSELTNCIKVCITRPDLLTKDILTQTLNILAKPFETVNLPVLTHPYSWVEQSGFHFQKRYLLWAFSTQYSDYYMQYFSDLLSIANNSK
ncbi:hypothetical protein [Desulfoluna spongiiphila]|uniref:hypothetical protein n=1 Tax=Desulfoluna spongiiphila TaxID=419481 RepID=UPI00125A3FC2|nr:hypothetical protein [Desulfoluna spongiiphila]VVS91094.1 hypothetical protein DBB_6620 [Desulfoluna spongiiphila]